MIDEVLGEVCHACIFDGWARSFHGGYAVVEHQLIDSAGQACFTNDGFRGAFSDGLIAVRPYSEPYNAGPTDYLDAAGKVQLTVPGRGDEFSEQLAAVDFDGKFGFIDKQGKVVIQPEFAAAQQFSNGLAAVAPGLDKYAGSGYINRKGELVTPTHFNEVRPAEKEYAIVHYGGAQPMVEDAPPFWVGGRWLMIDRAGRPLAVISEDTGEW